jgi:hypothetical protein
VSYITTTTSLVTQKITTWPIITFVIDTFLVIAGVKPSSSVVTTTTTTHRRQWQQQHHQQRQHQQQLNSPLPTSLSSHSIMPTAVSISRAGDLLAG